MAFGPIPTRMVATGRPAPGLTSEMVPSSSLATQASPPPTVTPAGPRPTGMRSMICPAWATWSRRLSALSVTQTPPAPTAIPFARPQGPPRLPVDGQRVGLPPAAVEGNHQLLVRPLTQRLGGNDGLQFADDAGVLAERQIRLDPVFGNPGAQLLQPGDLRLSERLPREICERPAAPQRERLAKLPGGAAGLPRSQRALAGLRQVLEPGQVNLLWRGPQEVATRPGQHTRAPGRRGQRFAQPPDIDIHGMAGAGPRLLPPQLVDGHIPGNRLGRVPQQGCPQRPPRQAAHVPRAPVEGEFSTSEQTTSES